MKKKNNKVTCNEKKEEIISFELRENQHYAYFFTFMIAWI